MNQDLRHERKGKGIFLTEYIKYIYHYRMWKPVTVDSIDIGHIVCDFGACD